MLRAGSLQSEQHAAFLKSGGERLESANESGRQRTRLATGCARRFGRGWSRSIPRQVEATGEAASDTAAASAMLRESASRAECPLLEWRGAISEGCRSAHVAIRANMEIALRGGPA
jgi:hypothetical protein